ncbi:MULTISPECIES: hypothetical protein [Agrobacterium]|uniref:Uncharacterized protein n=1 Tax=Agrobacterium rosae TaxID=1972867 RepID=A0AAE5VP43_9HYPH|nr:MULTISPECIES: hypothetical protein [Agrobacterium]KAA3510034.1 hypothetical protein DXM21_19500 [Agrobacterium rosae]KAA3515022.1 hypothetical protein DXM25_20870 [Agrobacterium rosae]MBN7805037.1 hypothetical protein [Agrobacterium rosae]MCM2433295.1 hypothetical protein [Agrobacterium rosae]MDX8300709.1 hypothetical protein [Agrobacterium rosae]
MRALINSPSLSVDTMDYQVECQFALEPSINGLLEKAEGAGWDRQHAVLAIVALVSGQVSEATFTDDRLLS